MKEIWKRISWMDGVLGVGIVMVLIGIATGFSKNQTSYSGKIKGVGVTAAVTLPVAKNDLVTVEVAGAVVKPGVYSLKVGSRVREALIASGGLALRADRIWVAANINQARILKDEEKVFIPEVGEKITNLPNDSISKVEEKVSINRASKEQLIGVSGIGPAMAGWIVDYRNKLGGYKNLEDLKKIPGIGEKTYLKIVGQLSL